MSTKVRSSRITNPAIESNYWNGRGRHQEKSDALLKQLEELPQPINWLSDEMAYWALLNGVCGLYHGFHNDGDDAKGAIDNNRVHGFHTLAEFRGLVVRLGAESVVVYLDSGLRIERAMDQAIQMCWEHINK